LDLARIRACRFEAFTAIKKINLGLSGRTRISGRTRADRTDKRADAENRVADDPLPDRVLPSKSEKVGVGGMSTAEHMDHSASRH